MNNQTLRSLDNHELAREIAHARNKRDAFAAGREPAEVRRHLNRLLAEQARRRVERAAPVSRVGYGRPDKVR